MGKSIEEAREEYAEAIDVMCHDASLAASITHDAAWSDLAYRLNQARGLVAGLTTIEAAREMIASEGARSGRV